MAGAIEERLSQRHGSRIKQVFNLSSILEFSVEEKLKEWNNRSRYGEFKLCHFEERWRREILTLVKRDRFLPSVEMTKTAALQSSRHGQAVLPGRTDEFYFLKSKHEIHIQVHGYELPFQSIPRRLVWQA